MGETRRRGTELEEAILEAAWTELEAAGSTGFTIAGVAERARTSKAVLYRRWAGRAELLTAAVQRRLPRLGSTPDTGTLRGDVLAVLQGLVARHHGLRFIADVDGELAGHLQRLATADVTAQLAEVVARKATHQPTQRVLRVPIDLVHHDLFFHADDLNLDAIVDEVFLPLITDRPPQTAAGHTADP